MDTGLKTQDSRHRTQDTRHRTRDTGLRIRDRSTIYLFQFCLSRFVSCVLLICFFVVGFTGCGDDNPVAVSDADQLISEGWKEYSAGNYDDAIAKYQQALDLDEDSVGSEAYNGIGWAKARIGRLLESMESFKEAVAKNPANTDAHAGLAGMYLADSDYERAIASASLVLSLNPEYASHHDGIEATDIRILLAECYYYDGDYENVEKQLDLLGQSHKDLDSSSSTYVADLLSYIQGLSKIGNLTSGNQ